VEPLILVLDAGTLGARASLISATGAFVATELGEWTYDQDSEFYLRRSFDPLQQAAMLGRLAARCLSRLRPTDTTMIQAIALTGQRSGTVFLDVAGRALLASPQFDARGFEVLEELTRLFHSDNTMRKTGRRPSCFSGAARLLWLRKFQRETAKQVASMSSIPGFFTACLTGSLHIPETPSTAADLLLLNLENGQWDAQLLDQLNIDVKQLGTIQEPGTICGHLAPDIAESLGLHAGIPVILAGSGTVCAGFGAGAMRVGDVVTTLGSVGSVHRLVSDLEFPTDPRLCLSPYALPKLHSVEASCGEVGFVSNWFAQELAPGSTWEQLFNEAGQVPAHRTNTIRASMGPRLQARDDPSPKSHNTWRLPRGLPTGRYTTRGAMFRSLLENIAFAVKQTLASVESSIFPERTPLIRLAGALARNDLVGNILGSVLDRPVSIPDREQVTSLGAATIAAVAVGLHSSFESASLAMAAPPRIYQPNKDLTPIYEEAFDAWLELEQEAS
jgi:sugar (pentulose or hexulose) kinase